MQLKFNFFLSLYCMLYIFFSLSRWNVIYCLIWMYFTHILSWMTTFYSVFLVQYINQPFSDQIPAFPMYWPIFYFFCSPTSLFFFCIAVSLPHFILLPLCSPALSLTLLKFPHPSLSYPLHSLSLSTSPVAIPNVHASVLEQNVPRTNLPQLTALNHDPWPPHHSAGSTLRYGWSVHLRSSSTLLSSCLMLLALLSF